MLLLLMVAVALGRVLWCVRMMMRGRQVGGWVGRASLAALAGAPPESAAY